MREVTKVSFAKEPYERDGILQKRPIIGIEYCCLRQYSMPCIRREAIHNERGDTGLFCKRAL